MTKVAFKVSARTARLIGRENVSSPKGAVIELVKNAYDADSSTSIVFFDNKLSQFRKEIDNTYYLELISNGISNDLLSKVYNHSEIIYTLKPDIPEYELQLFRREIAKLNFLYIIDSGDGMTQNIIKDYWMTIGTNNKEENIFTKSGRIKSGAKGIGRFALDRLGSKCEMTTIFNPARHEKDIDDEGIPTQNIGYRWTVDWEDFEQESVNIDSIQAELFGISQINFAEEVKNILESFYDKIDQSINKFEYGTILKISGLRENWEDFYVDQIYSDLEVLVPPKESGEFQIYVFSSLESNKYGEVLGSVCDDFDYKLIAHADENQNVRLKIYRNEYDIDLIDTELYSRMEMREYPFRQEEFRKGYWEMNTTFSKLLPGYSQVDQAGIFNGIGVFDFTFYFMKRTYSNSDVKRFFYKNFLANSRKDWLNKFGGIKLFRDNFRVRPYGEVKDSAFDWLSLGVRKSQSPAGIAKEDGGYRFEPENVAGAIKISRLTNVNFEDKSSREGLQENTTFTLFKLIINELISIVEEDRSYIARVMNRFYNSKYSDMIDKERAEALAKRVLEKNIERKEKKLGNSSESSKETYNNTETEKEAELTVLAELNREKDEEIEKLKDEQKVLRGLASSGIVLACFSHDFSKLHNVLNSRVDKLLGLISTRISESDYLGIEERKNPFVQLEIMRKQDVKLQNWLNFSLGAARKDKRKRKQLFLKKYFTSFKDDWNVVMENRGIDLDVSDIDQIDMRVFEIDFDSIFNNLLVNSIDAFNQSQVNRSRNIRILAKLHPQEIRIEYFDNGPGLSKDIVSPKKIFEPLYTTKRNAFTGEEEGTGLGMWLVSSIVKENDGNIDLLFPKEGFGLRMSFPVKFQRS